MNDRPMKKLYNGKLASLRTTEIERHIKAGGCVMTHGDEKMTMPPDRLRNAMFQCHKRKFKSKHPPYDYYELRDIPWVPDSTGDDLFGQEEVS